jgi:cell division protein FtsL
MSEKNTSIKIIFPFVVIIAAALVSIVILRKEIKVIEKQIIDERKTLTAKNEILEELDVEIQKLAAEERIVSYAEKNLGLVRSQTEMKTIYIDKKQIEQIEKIVNSINE